MKCNVARKWKVMGGGGQKPNAYFSYGPGNINMKKLAQ